MAAGAAGTRLERSPGGLATGSADGKHRQLLFEIVAVTLRALQNRLLAHEQFETLFAAAAPVFEQRHTNPSIHSIVDRRDLWIDRFG